MQKLNKLVKHRETTLAGLAFFLFSFFLFLMEIIEVSTVIFLIQETCYLGYKISFNQSLTALRPLPQISRENTQEYVLLLVSDLPAIFVHIL